jgi:hypothetical protein
MVQLMMPKKNTCAGPTASDEVCMMKSTVSERELSSILAADGHSMVLVP